MKEYLLRIMSFTSLPTLANYSSFIIGIFTPIFISTESYGKFGLILGLIIIGNSVSSLDFLKSTLKLSTINEEFDLYEFGSYKTFFLIISLLFSLFWWNMYNFDIEIIFFSSIVFINIILDSTTIPGEASLLLKNENSLYRNFISIEPILRSSMTLILGILNFELSALVIALIIPTLAKIFYLSKNKCYQIPKVTSLKVILQYKTEFSTLFKFSITTVTAGILRNYLYVIGGLQISSSDFGVFVIMVNITYAIEIPAKIFTNNVTFTDLSKKVYTNKEKFGYLFSINLISIIPILVFFYFVPIFAIMIYGNEWIIIYSFIFFLSLTIVVRINAMYINNVIQANSGNKFLIFGNLIGIGLWIYFSLFVSISDLNSLVRIYFLVMLISNAIKVILYLLEFLKIKLM